MRNLMSVTVLSAAILLINLPASAADIVGPADAGRVTQPQLENTLPTLAPQSIETNQPPSAQAPAGADKINFTLSGITYEGLTVYTPEQLLPVYADRLNKSISLADVYGIAAQLTAKYRNDGYVLTQVVVPPQTIEGGSIRLQVVEGFVDNVTVEGNVTDRERGLILKYANRVKGQPLNTSALERSLLLINDLPGISVRGILSPSATSGASDLRVIVERKSYNAELGMDNYGSLYLGRLEGYAAASANSLLGLNERISSTLVYVPNDGIEKELAYGDVTYSQPIGAYGTRVEFSGALTSTNPGFDLAQFKVNGQSTLLSAKVVQPLVRTRNLNWSVYSLFDWRHVNTQSNIDPTKRDRISALRLGTKFDRLDTFLGGGFNTLSVELAHGMNIFGASDKGDANLSRAEGNPEFTKLEGEYQRLQHITQHLNLLMAVKGQLANDAMLSSEEFGIGGASYGRGYNSSEILGDSGVAGKLELQLTNPVEINHVRTWQLYTFFDGGRVWNRDATTSADDMIDLASTGAGVRVTLPSETKMGAYVALPLNRDVQTQGNQDPRFYFNFNQSF